MSFDVENQLILIIIYPPSETHNHQKNLTKTSDKFFNVQCEISI